MAPVQVIAIITASVVGLAQLQANIRQAKIANTLSILNGMQTAQFRSDYRDSILFLEDSVLRPNSAEPPAGIETKMEHVLGIYSDLWVMYKEELVDREVVQATVGAQMAQFWLLTTKVLSPEQRRGYENVGLFSNELEKCEVVQTNGPYQQLKERLK